MSTSTSNLDAAVAKIAGAIDGARGARQGGGFLSPGDVSDLRRMDIAVPCAAFWRLMDQFGDDLPHHDEEAERRWALILRGMATMAPRAHDPSVRPGAALSMTGFSSEDRPIRVNRLLKAEGEGFEDLLLSACRFLASKAQPVDWRSFARFALYQDEAARKELARDFYSTRNRRTAA